MYRELRITISIFLIFFIYGLSSYFSLGGFVTPFFISKLILVGVSIAFLLMNLKLNKNWLLISGVFAMVSAALMDDFTVTFLAQQYGVSIIDQLANNYGMLYVTFVLYYGFFITSALVFGKMIHKWGGVALVLMVLGSVALFIAQYYLLSELLFAAFLLFFFVFNSYKGGENENVLDVVAALFLLQLTLDSFKYLV